VVVDRESKATQARFDLSRPVDAAHERRGSRIRFEIAQQLQAIHQQLIFFQQSLARPR
jgi:hypothetical protein